MSFKADIQRNKFMHFEDTLVMYEVYSTETSEKPIKTVHVLHSKQSMYESLFAGQMTKAYKYCSQMHGDHGIQHYAINSILYLRTIKDKYIEMYNEFISQLYNYAKVIRILAKVYLLITLVTPLKLQDILALIKETLTKTNPDYDIVIKRLHWYYDMKLVTFRIDTKRNLIIQFPVFVQPYTHQPLILYQLETVPVIDKNTRADTYMKLQIRKPYIALNTETYINIRQQELTTCKKTGYEFYCKEPLVVRHKSRQSCQSAIFFDLDKEIIKQNCEFKFYYNKTNVTPTSLNSRNEIILAHWPDDKHIICTINSDIPLKILSHLYVLVNRSVLFNCGIKAENNFVLESLAACHDADTNLVMYFTVKTPFINYIDQLTSLKN